MPFLNFGGNKNKHCNLSDMNFFMKNIKNRYSDPDPDLLWNRIRIHFFQVWIRIHVKMRWIRNTAWNIYWKTCLRFLSLVLAVKKRVDDILQGYVIKQIKYIHTYVHKDIHT